ncbi:MAG: transposase [Actinomycetota bacterium]
MTRPRRIDQPGMIHHVMNRGVDRRPVFFADQDRLEFGRLLGEIHDRFDVVVLAYCLMDNHFHLLLECPEAQLSEAMKHLGSVYVLHTNDRLGRDGPMFRGRFRSIPVLDDDYLLTAHRYIHRNPLGIASVATPDRYRWSSHRAYLGLRPSPGFLGRERVMSHFGGSVDRYQAFVESGDRRRHHPLALSELTSAVRLAIAMRPLAAGDAASDRWLDRTVLLAIGHGLPSPLRRALDDRLDRPSVRAFQRARRRLTNDEEIQHIVRDASTILGVDLGADPAATHCA